MAIAALNSAATGLRALSTRIDVVANNLANAETTAFKRQRANFEDLMYLTLKQPGAQNASGELAPAGIFVGLGVRISNTQLDLEQGSMENTGRPFDVAISGQGFFRVKVDPNVGDGLAYTRNGNLFVNNENELVLGMGDGYKIDPPIQIPSDATEVNISEAGQVTVLRPGQIEKQTVGQLQLYQFVNPNGLTIVGGSLYQETDSSGAAIESKPNENGAGKLLQNFLEGSNVDPVKELVTLIKTQRAFELNSQSIQTADQALQTIGNLRRM
ncbi:MAG: flagellar basal-body rod protein FlgG [Burkholderiales bacterium]|nr:flagellar basal-body rod protein FlgG [Phycisphaerae bacterium]